MLDSVPPTAVGLVNSMTQCVHRVICSLVFCFSFVPSSNGVYVTDATNIRYQGISLIPLAVPSIIVLQSLLQHEKQSECFRIATDITTFFRYLHLSVFLQDAKTNPFTITCTR